MLTADHLNIGGLPFLVKCVRKFRSALGGEVTHRGLCKSMSKKMNLNVCQRVCEPKNKCDYEHKYGYEFESE